MALLRRLLEVIRPSDLPAQGSIPPAIWCRGDVQMVLAAKSQG
jgi:hypothetical protein